MPEGTTHFTARYAAPLRVRGDATTTASGVAARSVAGTATNRGRRVPQAGTADRADRGLPVLSVCRAPKGEQQGAARLLQQYPRGRALQQDGAYGTVGLWAEYLPHRRGEQFRGLAPLIGGGRTR